MSASLASLTLGLLGRFVRRYAVACRPHSLARRRALRALARLCLARGPYSSILLIWRGSNASATALASPQSIPSCCSNLTSRLKRSSVAAA